MNTRKTVYNELNRLLLSLVPDLLESETPKEIKGKVLQIPKGRTRDLTVALANWLEYHGNILICKETHGGLIKEIDDMRKIARDLRKLAVWRYDMRQKLQKLVSWFTKLPRRAK